MFREKNAFKILQTIGTLIKTFAGLLSLICFLSEGLKYLKVPIKNVNRFF